MSRRKTRLAGVVLVVLCLPLFAGDLSQAEIDWLLARWARVEYQRTVTWSGYIGPQERRICADLTMPHASYAKYEFGTQVHLGPVVKLRPRNFHDFIQVRKAANNE